MGAAHVKAALTRWAGHVSPGALNVLVTMALTARDADTRPVYWAGHSLLARLALGHEDYSASDARRVKRLVAELRAAGAVSTQVPPAPGRHAHYVIELDDDGWSDDAPVTIRTGGQIPPPYGGSNPPPVAANGWSNLTATGGPRCPPEEEEEEKVQEETTEECGQTSLDGADARAQERPHGEHRPFGTPEPETSPPLIAASRPTAATQEQERGQEERSAPLAATAVSSPAVVPAATSPLTPAILACDRCGGLVLIPNSTTCGQCLGRPKLERYRANSWPQTEAQEADRRWHPQREDEAWTVPEGLGRKWDDETEVST